jgi:hypothetical protein
LNDLNGRGIVVASRIDGGAGERELTWGRGLVRQIRDEVMAHRRRSLCRPDQIQTFRSRGFSSSA